MAKACPICRSKKWRKDRVSGLVVCEEGHILQNFRTETNDMDEAPRTAMKKRHIKKGPRRRKRRARGELNPDHYRGDAKEYLRLQLFQLLLRHQVKAAIGNWKLPPELETISRDLWACVISLYDLPPPFQTSAVTGTVESPAEIGPRKDASRTRQPGPVSASQPLPTRRSEASSVPSSDTEKASDGQVSDGARDSDEESSNSDEGHGVGSDILDRMSDSSLSSATRRRLHSQAATDNGSNRRRHVQADTTLVVLILGFWILRVPILLVDIKRAIDDGTLPFIDFGSTDAIPEAARKHLAADLRHGQSWPHTSPSIMDLHNKLKTAADALDKRFGLKIPEMNAAPVLWRLTRSLGGTPMLYYHAISILDLTEAPLSMTVGSDDLTKDPAPSSDSEGDSNHGQRLRRRFSGGPAIRRSRGLAGPPELSILSAIIIAFKLQYSLDGTQGLPAEANELAVGQPTGRSWLEQLRRLLEEGRFQRIQLSTLPRDFSTASEHELDEYVDRAERVLLLDRGAPADVGWLTDLFPMEATTTPSSWGHDTASLAAEWEVFHSTAPLIESSAGPSAAPPIDEGDYTIFDAKDLTGQLPFGMDTLISAAAQLTAIDKKYILQTLQATERRLFRAQRGIRGKTARRPD